MLDKGYILDRKYEVVKVLGSGGMGTVYLCRNNRLGNLWAIKEVLSEWRKTIDFLAEPNLLRDLRHAGIPRIIDIFYENDNLYMVEDYIEGINLKELVERQGRLEPEKIQVIFLQLCEILEYLHSFSPPIIYRDLKPSNIMIKANDDIVLVDFGIARTYKLNKESDTLVLGSFGYIAPEQLNNAQSNAQTDIYSLGATIYFLITGKAFSSLSEVQKTEIIVQDSYESIIKIVNKAMSINPEHRYKNITEIKNQLTSNIEIYPKTKVIPMETPINTTTKEKQVLQPKKGNKKAIHLLVGTIIFIAILFALYFLLSHNTPSKQNQPIDNKKANDSLVKNNPSTQTQPVDKDIITRGILYKDNPLVLQDNTENGNGKGKGKNKGKQNQNNFHMLFTLNPAASINNSKINISLNKIEVLNGVSILDLTIDNKTNSSLTVNLTKTFLLNGIGTSFVLSDISSNSISIPQNATNTIKLTFNDFDFVGNSYCFKTSINYGINKDINLFVDIK